MNQGACAFISENVVETDKHIHEFADAAHAQRFYQCLFSMSETDACQWVAPIRSKQNPAFLAWVFAKKWLPLRETA
ncbi:MAG: hypothetical protein JWQ21_1895 [Herminiimonas sp.]|nr:hypothetical protein [Herminiimonas sp.]